MKTTALRSQDIEQKWYLIDCSNQTLGRLSVRVANILRGKTKPEYTPNADVGDFVVLINAKNIKVTGSKNENKIYSGHSADTDVVVAAAHAYVNALNRLVFSEKKNSIHPQFDSLENTNNTFLSNNSN